mgnify:CR=1 FL=1
MCALILFCPSDSPQATPYSIFYRLFYKIALVEIYFLICYNICKLFCRSQNTALLCFGSAPVLPERNGYINVTNTRLKAELIFPSARHASPQAERFQSFGVSRRTRTGKGLPLEQLRLGAVPLGSDHRCQAQTQGRSRFHIGHGRQTENTPQNNLRYP